jgi:hypothetical protein
MPKAKLNRQRIGAAAMDERDKLCLLSDIQQNSRKWTAECSTRSR